jgi:anionic cell wall polymer biosynthesis LytR-Cps2A-Psr (LCP) family protein
MNREISIFLLIIIIFGLVITFSAYNYEKNENTRNKIENHTLLILAVDPSETRPGPGAVDTAMIVVVRNGTVANMININPGAVTHPNESAPTELAAMGDNKLYLHDTLWWSDIDKDFKLAQETVEYNTNITIDAVVIVKPEALDALINEIGPVHVPGQENVNISSKDFLQDDTSGNNTKSDAIESLANALKNAFNSEEKRSKAFDVLKDQYFKGNIIILHLEAFYDFLPN